MHKLLRRKPLTAVVLGKPRPDGRLLRLSERASSLTAIAPAEGLTRLMQTIIILINGTKP